MFSRVTGSVPQNVTGMVAAPSAKDTPETVIVAPVEKWPMAADRTTSSPKLSTASPPSSTAVTVTVTGWSTYLVPAGTVTVKRSTGR